jgi:PBP1b-binding outer membrane lipoprotein LpoB
MPAYTMSGCDSETATAPTDEVLKNPSETARHVTPPSVVFHSPPPVAPK